MKTKTIEAKHNGESYTVVVTLKELINNGDYWVYDNPNTPFDGVMTKNNLPNSWFEKLHDRNFYLTVICCTPPIEGIDGMRELKIAKPNIIDWRRIERDFYQYRKSLVTVYGEEPITTPSALFFFLEHNELSPFAHKAELKIQEEKLAEKRAKDICKNNTYLLDEPEVQEIIKAWQEDIDKKANTSGGKWSELIKFIEEVRDDSELVDESWQIRAEKLLQSLSHWEYQIEIYDPDFALKSDGTELRLIPKIIIEGGRRIVEGKWKQVKG